MTRRRRRSGPNALLERSLQARPRGADGAARSVACDLRSPATALALTLALAAAGAPLAASAATFQLDDGETITGVIAQVGDEHVSIRGPSGYRLVKRDAIRLVMIERPDGTGVAGKLTSWADGVYELSTTRGAYRIDDKGVEAGDAPADMAADAGATRSASDALLGRTGGFVAGDDLVTRAPVDVGVRAMAPLPPLSILQNPPPTPSAPPTAPPAAPQATGAKPETGRELAAAGARAEPAPKPKTADKPAPAQTPVATAPPAPRPSMIELSAKPETARNAAGAGQPAGQDPGKGAGQGAAQDSRQAVGQAARHAPSAALAANAAPAPTPARAAGSDARPFRARALPLSDEDRDRRDAAYLAALGVRTPAPDAESCALLADMTAPPAAAFGRREDREAVVLTLDGQASRTAARRLAVAYYDVNRAESAERDAGLRIMVEQTRPRIALPQRIGVLTERDRAHAIAALESGQADLALIVEPPLGAIASAVSRALTGSSGADGGLEDTERLIGFDAIAIVTAPDSPIRALSPEMLGAILSGRIDDWSMVAPSHVGKPVVYLPSEGASALTAVLDFVDVRRARPANVRFIDLAEDRLAAALADPNGIALAPWSVLRAADMEDAAVAIGRGETAIRLSLDSIRSGAYPLIVPVVLRTSRQPATPGALQLAQFLSSASGQRAIFSAGLAPVAACDPSTCPLQTPGLEKARLRLRTHVAAPTSVETASAPVTARSERLAVRFPAEGSGTEGRDALARFLAETGATGALTVRAAAADGAEDVARLRGEAVALALRCGGRSVARTVFDRFATPPDGAESAVWIIEE